MTIRSFIPSDGRFGAAELADSVPTPLYYRVWEDIYGRIVRGELKPGDLLPPERELQLRYGVSRTTIRAALKELEAQQLIVRKQGRGTLVAQPRVYLQGGSLQTLAEDLGPIGRALRAELVEAETIAALPQIARSLRVAIHAPVLHVVRRRLVSTSPIAVSEGYYPQWVADRLTEDHLRSPSILQMLERECSIPLVEADYYIEAALPSRRIAKLLDVSTDTPALIVTRTTYSTDKTPVSYVRQWYRGDMVGYTAHVQRLHSSGE